MKEKWSDENLDLIKYIIVVYKKIGMTAHEFNYYLSLRLINKHNLMKLLEEHDEEITFYSSLDCVINNKSDNDLFFELKYDWLDKKYFLVSKELARKIIVIIELSK